MMASIHVSTNLSIYFEEAHLEGHREDQAYQEDLEAHRGDCSLAAH